MRTNYKNNERLINEIQGKVFIPQSRSLDFCVNRTNLNKKTPRESSRQSNQSFIQ